MKSQTSSQLQNDSGLNVFVLGFYAAILTALATVVTFVVAFLTPPLSGPGCQGPCFHYPFTDVAARFPRDYYWMYLAVILTIVYFVLAACIHYYAAPEKRVFSQIGLSFALISTAVLFIDYFLQVSVIQPSLVNGETEGIALLTQFNPHGIFIVLEEIGFFLMSLAFLFFAPVFSAANRVEKTIRWMFVFDFLLTILSFIFFSMRYGINREYWFEITVISINWMVLVVAGILLSIVFRRAMKTAR